MRESLRALATTATVALLGWSGVARADVAPLDSCPSSASAGQTCNNAGPNNDEPGVCVSTTCEHPTPDGSTSYACVLCELSDAGAPAQDAGKTGSSGSSTKSGCALSPLARDGATGIGMLALGLGALALARRRRT
jgi:hypothetical protein